MKALLLVAHGSRRESSNEEIRQVTRCLADKAGEQFGDVRCAFLELAEPSIPDGIIECAEAGASEVIVLPYFLSAGRHVAEDIPEEISKTDGRLPEGVIVRQADYLGSLDGITELLLSAANC
ncbi:MAG: CbiX/SirB N-terminal domain-containing protein [Chromatiales bacterium]|jgi:sirohydrochlorin ferrochelatase